jgi:chemotaxis signal transduction protein
MPTPPKFDTDTYIPYMRDVVRCEQSLSELNMMWRMIESSAKMSCPVEAAAILPTMAATRDGFKQLERELVQSLVHEKVMTVFAEIATKAQYVIDIVVRNLFERTADVGFLAIDDELCRFVAGQFGPEEAVRARLRAYRNKYTVYDEIILLDTAGNVLLQIDEATPLEGSVDPLIAQTLASASYVETFRASDLRPGKRQALIYSRRMLHPDTGTPIGVLCLCFNFEEEMAGIFKSHGDPGARSNLLLTDAGGMVLASADPAWIAPGCTVPVNPLCHTQLQMHAERQYLVRTFGATGYQGYAGPPGWQGQVMIPLDVAFTGQRGQALAALEPDLARGLLAHADTFCPPLHEIMNAAETIRRVVWNGQVMTAGQRGDQFKLKVILDQISETGKRSDELFAQSIGDLYETALVSRQSNDQFMSRLLVDLLERNLYERANDCRWWALTPELRCALADAEHGCESMAQIGTLLDFINGLYTVYTRIFVYDEHGTILAASHESALDSIVGSSIDAGMLAQVRALAGEQDYSVTPFAPSALYGGAPTYVYHAAIRAPDAAERVVGGIGVVFDATPELAAMLAGALGERAGTSALLIDRGARVIASTDPARPVGSVLDLPPQALALPSGSNAAQVVIHDGQYAVMALTAGAGYREFKQSDGYRDDVLAVVFDNFGAVQEQGAGRAKTAEAVMRTARAGSAALEFATFFVDDSLFAVDAGHVAQALPAARLAPASMGGRAERAGIVALPDSGKGTDFVWVFDFRYMLCGLPSTVASDSQIIVVEKDGKSVGLLVGALHAVPQFDAAQIVATPFGGGAGGMLVPRVIKANGSDLLIQVIDADYLFGMLFACGAASAAALAAAAA